jgi:hypothetical protein
VREILLIIGWVLERTFEWRGGWCNILESVPLKCFYFNKKKNCGLSKYMMGFTMSIAGGICFRLFHYISVSYSFSPLGCWDINSECFPSPHSDPLGRQ